ncbi:LysR family transcriptional regulator [Pseudodonghicola xiamenensis]|uniref:LysR family transcriptional regulator n=2 Tax=Pseudodonghicola xiamenensis TaxID=337702 RepID=A0A8J3HBI3_9RHOB|nr:LysR family transcriptional regulator [Pseudodonghicola xiamenensis]
MGVSQPTLSAHVRALEARCGVNLLERKSSGVALSPEGEELFQITTRLFQAEQEANAFLRTRTRRDSGHLRIAADGPYPALSIFSQLRTERGNMTLTLAIDNSARVLERVLDRRADAAITARRPQDARLHGVKFLSTRIGLCLPRTHPLAAHPEGVALADILEQTFVMRERGSRTQEVFETNLAAHGLAIQSSIAVSSREGMREAVLNGMGCGVVTDLGFGTDPRLAFVPLLDAEERVDEYVVCLEDRRHQPLIRRFTAACLRPAPG